MDWSCREFGLKFGGPRAHVSRKALFSPVQGRAGNGMGVPADANLVEQAE
jgi:hypothetical protein